MRQIRDKYLTPRLRRCIEVVAGCVALISIGCEKSGGIVPPTATASPQVSAWYQAYFAKTIKPGMAETERKNVQSTAPVFLFMDQPKLAAEELNARIRAATSQAEATQAYWAALKQFNEFRRCLPTEMSGVIGRQLKQNGPTNVPQNTDNFLLSIGRYVSLVQEREAVGALEVRGVDERAINWAAEYMAWLQKREGLELDSVPDLKAQSQIPGAIVESMFRLGMGDPTYLAPLDEQRRAESQRVATEFESSKSYSQLSNAAADISADCLRVRAALSKAYGGDFVEIELQ